MEVDNCGEAVDEDEKLTTIQLILEGMEGNK